MHFYYWIFNFLEVHFQLLLIFIVSCFQFIFFPFSNFLSTCLICSVFLLFMSHVCMLGKNSKRRNTMQFSYFKAEIKLEHKRLPTLVATMHFFLTIWKRLLRLLFDPDPSVERGRLNDVAILHKLSTINCNCELCRAASAAILFFLPFFLFRLPFCPTFFSNQHFALVSTLTIYFVYQIACWMRKLYCSITGSKQFHLFSHLRTFLCSFLTRHEQIAIKQVGHY